MQDEKSLKDRVYDDVEFTCQLLQERFFSHISSSSKIILSLTNTRKDKNCLYHGFIGRNIQHLLFMNARQTHFLWKR